MMSRLYGLTSEFQLKRIFPRAHPTNTLELIFPRNFLVDSLLWKKLVREGSSRCQDPRKHRWQFCSPRDRKTLENFLSKYSISSASNTLSTFFRRIRYRCHVSPSHRYTQFRTYDFTYHTLHRPRTVSQDRYQHPCTLWIKTLSLAICKEFALLSHHEKIV